MLTSTPSTQKTDGESVALRASMSSSALQLLLKRLIAKLEPTHSDEPPKSFHHNHPAPQVL
ncbi:MAG: hypothetical protein AAF708_13535 [Deinococcota bacterium]